MNEEHDLTFKKIIKYTIIFVLLCILIYSLPNSGMINVNALTTSSIDKELSNINVSLSNREGGIYNGTSTLNYPLIFSNITTEINTLYFFDTYIYFSNLETIEEYRSSGSNVHFYITYHFKYYYNIYNTDYFNPLTDFFNSPYSFSESSIYEEKVYTSMDSNGKVSYDQFITFNFPFESINSINMNWSNPYFHPSIRPDYREIPNLDSSVEVVYAMFTSENATPMSIEEYIANSDTDYYEPELLPYEDDDKDDTFITKIVKDILEGFKDFGKSVWLNIKLFFNKVFVPSSGFFKVKYLELEIVFNEKFGIFVAPIRIFINFIERFLTLSSENINNFVINVPEYTIPGFDKPILKATSYNLSEVLNNGTINRLWLLYLDFIDCFLIISFMNLAWNKLSSFLGGMGTDNTYYSVDDIDTYDKATGELISSRQRVRTTHQKKRRNI